MANNYKKATVTTAPGAHGKFWIPATVSALRRICVTPGNILSLQSHDFRNEHWIIVSGEAVVTLGEDKIVKKAGENVFIPVKMKHRIQNNTDKNMEFIEVQTGETLDENDIIRYEDSYGRAG